MSILAIDAGSKEFGWCYVLREGARARFADGGNAPATRDGFLGVVRAIAEVTIDEYGIDTSVIDAVYVETPEGMIFKAARSPAIIETSRLVGGIDWECERFGVACHLRTAGWWRKALIGKASSPKKGLIDKLVADAVPRNIIGWPLKSNVHVRDAAGLACVACWEMAGRGGRAA